MCINLSHEDREKAALSVGASGEWMGGVGLETLLAKDTNSAM